MRTLRVVLAILCLAVVAVAVCYGFVFYKIVANRPIAKQTTESFILAVQQKDMSQADALITPELLAQYPDFLTQLGPAFAQIQSIRDILEDFVGGYSISTQGETYTYYFLVTYTDGTTGKGTTHLVYRDGSWLISSIQVTADP